VDIANRTGDAKTADALATHLTDVGLVVGTVTTTADSTAPSAIQYGTGQHKNAERLADALGQTPLVTRADVPDITLVLTATDPSGLLESLQKFPGLCTTTTAPPSG
jgi:LytR cell envelope-related transcriptional attenuator